MIAGIFQGGNKPVYNCSEINLKIDYSNFLDRESDMYIDYSKVRTVIKVGTPRFTAKNSAQ